MRKRPENRKQKTENRKTRIQNLLLIICRLSSVVCILILSGCATVSSRAVSSKLVTSNHINIESFCRKYNLEYSFDTIDDIVRMHSEDKEIKILLNSPISIINGSFFTLGASSVYSKGAILIPRQLEEILTTKRFTPFKPLFTVKTIVIDPGHGGKDPGAISSTGLKEKAINLIVSKYLKKELEKRGFKVILTRVKDTQLTLKARVDTARKHNADIFISIHTNSNRSSKVSGQEIYYLSPSRLNSRERSLRIAKTESFRGKNFPFDVKAMLWDLSITKNYSFSIELANESYLAFRSLGFKVRPPKKAPFYVLRFAYTPAVLVEVGYLSNYYEEKALRKKYYQKQLAQAIAVGITSLQKRHNNEQ